MKGFVVKEFGGPENMLWETLPMPEPQAGEVLVKVRASGINFAETRMRAGTYSGQPLPFIMGMEGAGEIVALGEGVSDYSVGENVFGRARGCHAEYVCFETEHLFRMPEGMSFTDAAAIPVGWLTAWHALYTVGQMSPKQRILIEAVAGSVGSAAVQIAKQQECWVAGTASRDDKLAVAQKYGVDLLINYKQQSVSTMILKETKEEGVNIGLMTIGEETAQDMLDSMGMDGKVVMFGSTGGRDITFNLVIGVKNLQLLSMSISTSPAFFAHTMHDFRERALPLFADGTFMAMVDTVLPVQELVLAHQMIDDRKHFGKVILTL